MSQLKYYDGHNWVPVVVGAQGIQGLKGDKGETGLGIPTDGTDGQIVIKDSTTVSGSAWSSDFSRAPLWYSSPNAVTLTATSAAQSIFGFTTGAPLEDSTTYYIDMMFYTTTAESSAGHYINLSFSYSGTLNSTSGITYTVQSTYNQTSSGNQTVTGNYSSIVTTTGESTIVAAQSAGTYYRTFSVRGIIRTTTSGALIPKITWPSGITSGSVGKNSYIRLMKLGADSAVSNPIGW